MTIWALTTTVIVEIEYKKNYYDDIMSTVTVLLRYRQYRIIVLQLFKARSPRNDGIKIKPIEYNNFID